MLNFHPSFLLFTFQYLYYKQKKRLQHYFLNNAPKEKCNIIIYERYSSIKLNVSQFIEIHFCMEKNFITKITIRTVINTDYKVAGQKFVLHALHVKKKY